MTSVWCEMSSDHGAAAASSHHLPHEPTGENVRCSSRARLEDAAGASSCHRYVTRHFRHRWHRYHWRYRAFAWLPSHARTSSVARHHKRAWPDGQVQAQARRCQSNVQRTDQGAACRRTYFVTIIDRQCRLGILQHWRDALPLFASSTEADDATSDRRRDCETQCLPSTKANRCGVVSMRALTHGAPPSNRCFRCMGHRHRLRWQCP